MRHAGPNGYSPELFVVLLKVLLVAYGPFARAGDGVQEGGLRLTGTYSNHHPRPMTYIREGLDRPPILILMVRAFGGGVVHLHSPRLNRWGCSRIGKRSFTVILRFLVLCCEGDASPIPCEWSYSHECLGDPEKGNQGNRQSSRHDRLYHNHLPVSRPRLHPLPLMSHRCPWQGVWA